MTLAPIILFVYNRPEHTRRTVAALQKNQLAEASDLIIYADAAKNEAAQAGVNEVRAYLRTIAGFKSVKIVERRENFGLAKSIISGVTETVNRCGQAIVLEDDLETSPYFLSYMNEALDFYRDQPRVVSVHGYVYPVKEPLPETFFLRGADCWGWATWKRGWDIFEPDGRKLLQELRAKKLTRKFDLDGAYPYTQLLASQIWGLNDSWAVRWYTAAFLADKLTLYPGRSLVNNIGFDKSGTHTGTTNVFAGALSQKRIIIQSILLAEDDSARRAIKHFFHRPLLRLLTAFMRWKFFLARIRRL